MSDASLSSLFSPRFSVVLALLAASSVLAEKSLHWSRVDVIAKLDAEGRLHIAERQAIVFTGDWNGGERVFNPRLGQKIHLERISRVDSFGDPRPLQQGDLSQVDQWAWHDSKTLRWRSRLPSDPPFDHTEIVYLIEYTMSNILRAERDRYILDHDFAFPDRREVIEKFTLRLEFDGAWSPATEVPQYFERANLPPGEGFVLDIALRYLPEGRPAGVYVGVHPQIAYLVAACFVFAVGALLFVFFLNEKRAGRFQPLIPAEQINEAWLQEHLFKYPPEVVGATWDERTGSAEVAAVLARMTSERKLQSRVEKGGFLRGDVLHLNLLVDRERLQGYEAALVKSLFFAGNQTSTKLIREHYKKRGFNPVSKIEEPVRRMSRKLGITGRGTQRRRLSWKPAVVMVLVAIAFLVVSGFVAEQNIVGAAAGPAVIFAIAVFGIIGASLYSNRVANLALFSLVFVIPLVVLTAAVVTFLIIAPKLVPLSLLLLIGIALFALAAIHLVLFLAAGAFVGERFEIRRRFAAAREFFKRQLQSREPRLRDEWFPYLLAFGLGPHIDRWFRAFGGIAATSSRGGMSGSSFSSSSASSGRSWTGGGGAFGGAGASGSWAVAAGALAAGVSAPSSGGGGGGGGSSGGGGGGGW